LNLILNRFEGWQRRILEAVAPGTHGGTNQPANVARALLDGPLRHIGAFDRVNDAERRAEQGDSLGAARVLLDVARELEVQGLQLAGESLSERAAAHLAAGGQVDDAADVLLQVATARIDRGSARSQVNLQLLRDLLPADMGWLPDALDARATWPEGVDEALNALAVAAVSSARRPDHADWVAAHVELLMLYERYVDALEAAATLRSEPISAGGRLRVGLDVADALEATGDREAAEREWLRLLRWADEQGSPFDRAVAWQRRAVAFAQREEIPQSHDAYRRAMASWAELPGYEEQAGDALFSMHAVSIANARPPEDLELRPIAAELRGSPKAPVARAERLQRDAMSARLLDRLPDALSSYWRALAIHRQVGSFVGATEVRDRLAELYAHAGELAIAISLYVRIGKGKLAAELAKNVEGSVVAEAVSAGQTRWERDARYSVIAATGSRLPEEYLGAMGEELLNEAAQAADRNIAPLPALTARRALASAALGLPNQMRSRAWEQLKEDLWHPLMNIVQAASNALVLATNADLTNAREELVDRFVDDPYNVGISSAWLATEAENHAAVREKLISAARDGSQGALEVLASAGLIEGDSALEQAATSVTESAADIVTYEEQREGGLRTVSYGMGVDLAGPGLVARAASASARERLLNRLLEIITDAREPEPTRASAAHGLFNLAPALDLEQAKRVADQLPPLAVGLYEPSELDENVDHPLSRTRIILHTPQELRASAIGTLGQLLAKHSSLSGELLLPAVDQALRDGSDGVIAAVFDAGARLPNLQLPVPLEAALRHPEANIRVNALVAWAARNDGMPEDELLHPLIADPDIRVRLQLLAMAAENLPTGEPVLQRLSDMDPDAYVRAKTRQRMRASGQS
jgi:tetratricopeptide (TPR) repeat protein